MTGIVVGIYVACLAFFVMAYILLDDIHSELKECNRYLKKLAERKEAIQDDLRNPF